MTKFDFGLLLLLVMMVFMILNALHVTFVPPIRSLQACSSRLWNQ